MTESSTEEQLPKRSWWRWLEDKVRSIYKEALKFGVVGILGLIVDVGVFNLVLYTPASPLYDKPISAKILSVILATIVAYAGNRLWTFRDRATLTVGKGYLIFFLLNGVAMGIALACLGFTHYVLNLTGPLADNIAANVVGLGLGTIFRFWSYRKWVFPEVKDQDERKAIMGTIEI
ncbi:MAG: GtrA family protein [Actinobacteria bacterium]|nr:GtrA family protein [Actinomycetota bacterium]